MNKENWNKFLSEIIKSSINNFNMIGDNLRVQCIKHFEQLETNRDEALKFIKDEWYYDGTPIDKIEEILKRGKE